jgi:hypothetical protein
MSKSTSFTARTPNTEKGWMTLFKSAARSAERDSRFSSCQLDAGRLLSASAQIRLNHAGEALAKVFAYVGARQKLPKTAGVPLPCRSRADKNF